MLTDRYGLPITTTSQAARDAYIAGADGVLAAVIYAVRNTFGERHIYLLAGPTLDYGRQQTARKVFHVSPFCLIEGGYRFRFVNRPDRAFARIDHDGGVVVDAADTAIQCRLNQEVPSEGAGARNGLRSPEADEECGALLHEVLGAWARRRALPHADARKQDARIGAR